MKSTPQLNSLDSTVPKMQKASCRAQELLSQAWMQMRNLEDAKEKS
jgi:hypothetical protein